MGDSMSTKPNAPMDGPTVKKVVVTPAKPIPPRPVKTKEQEEQERIDMLGDGLAGQAAKAIRDRKALLDSI